MNKLAVISAFLGGVKNRYMTYQPDRTLEEKMELASQIARLDGLEHRTQRPPLLGQRVVRRHGSVLLDAPADQVGVLEVVEHPRERARTRAGRALEFVEPLLALAEVVDDEEPPALADVVDGLDRRAGGRVALRDVRVETPLMTTTGAKLAGKKPCFVSILRAGEGLLPGMLDLAPSARVGHVGLYRDHETLEPVQYYFKMPQHLEERIVLLVDPMLATGNSAAAALALLEQAGARDIRFVCLVAAPEGVKALREAHPDVPIYTAALDERLNEKGYILPGLGDAGDRLFGTK